MSFGVRIDTNLPEFRRWVSLGASRQIPFATAVALTRLAKSGREDVVTGLPTKYVVRGKKLPQAMRFKPADRRAWPRPEAVVYTLAESMLLQEFGGTKRPTRNNLAIPGEGVRPTKETRITPSKRPKKLLARRGFFVNTLTSGRNSGADAILQRVGKDRYPLRVAYILRPRAEVKAALGFEQTVRERVAASFDVEFHRALDEAFKSRRR